MWHFGKCMCPESRKKTSIWSLRHRDRSSVCPALLSTKSRSRKKELVSSYLSEVRKYHFQQLQSHLFILHLFLCWGLRDINLPKWSGQDGKQAYFPKCCTVVLTWARSWQLNWFTLNNVLWGLAMLCISAVLSVMHGLNPELFFSLPKMQYLILLHSPMVTPKSQNALCSHSWCYEFQHSSQLSMHHSLAVNCEEILAEDAQLGPVVKLWNTWYMLYKHQHSPHKKKQLVRVFQEQHTYIF